MLKPVNSIKLAAVALAGAATIVLTVAGCTSSPESSSTSSPTSRPAAKSSIGHAELWARTCNRCHNAWSPDQLSSQQWEAVMAHMRFRGGLNEEEHRVILEFLQASR